MSLAYVLSLEADRDLEEIFDYGTLNFGFDQAVKYVSDIDHLFAQLGANPALGKERSELKSGLRSIAKESHVIFYTVLPEHIRIVRVLHGSRDIPRFFE